MKREIFLTVYFVMSWTVCEWKYLNKFLLNLVFAFILISCSPSRQEISGARRRASTHARSFPIPVSFQMPSSQANFIDVGKQKQKQKQKQKTLEDLCVQGVSKPGTVDTDIFFLQAAQQHREHYRDKTETVPPVKIFILPNLFHATKCHRIPV